MLYFSYKVAAENCRKKTSLSQIGNTKAAKANKIRFCKEFENGVELV
jgi:hypothetical protein